MSRIPLVRVADVTASQREHDRLPSNLTRALVLADDRLAGVQDQAPLRQTVQFSA